MFIYRIESQNQSILNKARRDLDNHLSQPLHFTDEETNFYDFDFLLVPIKLQHYLHAIACKNYIILFTKVTLKLHITEFVLPPSPPNSEI